MDFDTNKEEEEKLEKNNFFITHGIIKNKINDILSDDTDNYNKYLLLNNHKSRKRINTGSIPNIAKSHRLSDRGSMFGLPEFFKENDFIAYNEIISKNPNFSFLEGNTELLFDLDLYSIILNINNGQFDIALKFINAAKKIIVNGIKPLLSESYARGYELLVKNQLLFQLEQIIEYKQFHEKDEKYLKQMISIWDHNLNIIGKDPEIYEKILSLRSLVLTMESEYGNYINLAKMYRKLNMYEQSEKILKRIRDQLKLDSFDLGTNLYTLNSSRKNTNRMENDTIIELNDDGASDKSEFKLIKNDLLLTKEIKIQIELNYNRCLYEKGNVFEAIGKSKYLVDLLDKSEGSSNYKTDLNKLNDKIKSKIYGDYAIYKQNNLDKNINENIIKNKKRLVDNKEKVQKKLNIGLGKKTKSQQVLDVRKSLTVKKITKEDLAENKIDLNDKTDVNDINKYFILSIKFNKKSYKLWHSYALFNYKYYKYLAKSKISKIDEILLVSNAVEGFKHSLIIGGKNKNKTYQDLLRLLDIFFTSGIKNYELLSLIADTLDVVEIEAYLNVLPQLLCRFDIKDKKVLEILINILIKIGLVHPQAVIYSFIVMKLSSSKKRQSAAAQILYSICKKKPEIKDLVKECEMFINEINKCAMLLHEEWFETLENTSKMYYTKDYQGMAKYLWKLHEKAKEKPETMYEFHFYQTYGSDINEAGYYLKDFMENQNFTSLHQAWDIYLNIYSDIIEQYEKFETISLEYVSTKLHNFKDSKISLPGSYSIKNENYSKLNKLIRIQKMGQILKVFNTKQHPRKISMIGTDNKEYLFLLKGHEDLRQDERAMQLFKLINTIMANDKSTSNKNLSIITYAVFPLSPNTGIIGWVPNCDTLNQLIKEQRTASNIVQSIEHRKIFKLYPRFESASMINKIEIFQEALNETQGMEISNMIWIKAKNCETWLKHRTNYSRSLAVMSIVGYILGLGDRHPSNLMLSKKTGKIIHIDFGDCFEVAMKREKFPEKVPFRLTRMLVKALEVSGIEGTFRIISEKVMELLRNNKDSLLAILGSFLYDPLISFRLMIPMIMKMKKQKKNYLDNDEIFITEEDLRSNKNLSKSLTLPKVNIESFNEIFKKKKSNDNFEPKISHNIISNINIILIDNNNHEVNQNQEKIEDNFIKRGNQNDNHKAYMRRDTSCLNNEIKKTMNKIVGVSEESQKDEKKKMEDDERKMFNLYEENDEIDEIDSEKLNNIAQIVLDRIQDKLSGTDFNPNIIYNVKNQVDELIKSATSYENLAQSYLGWCPFW
jgi:phosphatidylinositol kinase/protein kinase (PI-3  family)